MCFAYYINEELLYGNKAGCRDFNRAHHLKATTLHGPGPALGQRAQRGGLPKEISKTFGCILGCECEVCLCCNYAVENMKFGISV